MAAIKNTLTLEKSLKDEYNAMLEREKQSDGFQISSFPSYDTFRAQRLQEFGLSPSADASQYTENITADGKQRNWNIVDANGNTVLNKDWTDDWSFWKDFGIPAAALAGSAIGLGALAGAGGAVGGAGAAAGAAGGAGGAAGAAGGAGALGAGASSGGLLGTAGAAAGAADAVLPTVFISGTSAAAPAALSAGQIAGLASAGAGAIGGLSSADKAALYGNQGYGSGMSGAQTSLYDGILGATGSPQLAGTVANSSLGSGLSSLTSSLGGWGNLASLAGGLLGGTQSTSNQSSVSNQIDPRMAAYIYGKGYGDPNSVLGAAQALFNQNRSGLNATMQQGLDMQKAALTNPAYGQAYTDMRTVGSGLLNAGVASNPFLTGQTGAANGLLAGNTATTGQGSGLLGGQSVQNYINSGRGLLVS